VCVCRGTTPTTHCTRQISWFVPASRYSTHRIPTIARCLFVDGTSVNNAIPYRSSFSLYSSRRVASRPFPLAAACCCRRNDGSGIDGRPRYHGSGGKKRNRRCNATDMIKTRAAERRRRNDGSGGKKRNQPTSFCCFIYSCAIYIGETVRTPRPTRSATTFAPIACRGKRKETTRHDTIPGCGSTTMSAECHEFHCVPSNAKIVSPKATIVVLLLPVLSISFRSVRFRNAKFVRSKESKPNNFLLVAKIKQTTNTIGEPVEAKRRRGTAAEERISSRWSRANCDLRACDMRQTKRTVPRRRSNGGICVAGTRWCVASCRADRRISIIVVFLSAHTSVANECRVSRHRTVPAPRWNQSSLGVLLCSH